MRDVGLTKRGVVIARLMLDLLQDGALFLGEDIFAASSRDILICAAAYIGQAERRPMTAANIAEIVGVPRPTVIRRLASLRQRGFVEQLENGRWIIPFRQGRHTRATAKIFATSAQHIHNAAAQLSKLDSAELAAQKRK